MRAIHSPVVNARYWAAITLASVFGTNMGDLYAHESGLGLIKGLGVLTVLVAGVFVAERFDGRRNEAYYWAVIVLIRTGATNIADALAYKVHVPEGMLTVGLLALLALCGWATRRASGNGLPRTDAAYWLAMLCAGVFGTVVGDICEHVMGEGVAASVLTVMLLAVLVAGQAHASRVLAVYWVTVAVARTSGTAIGDWLAEGHLLKLGLKAATGLSFAALVGVLVLWRSRGEEAKEG